MASWQEEPYNGSSVWCIQYGNGKVYAVDRNSRLVYCDFYDNGKHTVDLDDFYGMFDENLNQFVIIPI